MYVFDVMIKLIFHIYRLRIQSVPWRSRYHIIITCISFATFSIISCRDHSYCNSFESLLKFYASTTKRLLELANDQYVCSRTNMKKFLFSMLKRDYYLPQYPCYHRYQVLNLNPI